eukprot:6172269-Pleurochrysis_carterae.AAC.2
MLKSHQNADIVKNTMILEVEVLCPGFRSRLCPFWSARAWLNLMSHSLFLQIVRSVSQKLVARAPPKRQASAHRPPSRAASLPPPPDSHVAPAPPVAATSPLTALASPRLPPRAPLAGAGPTGLCAAYRLTELGYTNWELVEASPMASGLACTLQARVRALFSTHHARDSSAGGGRGSL